MTVGKSVLHWLGLTIMVTLLVLSCEGDQGPTGPQGFEGEEGPPGENYVPDPIANQTFGILINNTTSTDFAGALSVELTSDASATPSASRVVAAELAVPPIIDGIDGGASEWGVAQSSNITLSNVAAGDIGITSASVRFGYNLENVYMQIKWTEVAAGAFVVAPDTLKNRWRANNASSWTQLGGEDVVHVIWEANDVTGWDAQGAGAVFSGSIENLETAAAGELADLWTWGSTISYYTDYAQDRIIRDAAAGGEADDNGGPYVLPNPRVNNRPQYMRANSAITGSNYPLMDFEFAPFVQKNWRQGAIIPGYIYFNPARSAADILAVGKYDNGTWTVELQRKRNTGHGDDVLF